MVKNSESTLCISLPGRMMNDAVENCFIMQSNILATQPRWLIRQSPPIVLRDIFLSAHVQEMTTFCCLVASFWSHV